MSQKQLELKPIGLMIREGDNLITELDQKMRKGLKHLSKFSHGILIYGDDKSPNILNTALSQRVVRLTQVDEELGRLICRCPADIPGPAVLYDIKPYFPVEDRVRDGKQPARQRPLRNNRSRSGLLSELGIIRKIQGIYYLELDSPESYAVCEKVLKGHSHLKIFWWFHKFDKDIYRRTLEGDPPYEKAPRTGVFASRSPVRPNPLALTTAKILAMEPLQNRIRVSVLDCFDRTPMIGISPYRPEIDCCADTRVPEWLSHWPGWLDDREFEISEAPAAGASVFESLKRHCGTTPADRLSYPGNGTPSGYFDAAADRINDDGTAGIVIEGARQNNLKHIDVTIPYGLVTVITGISGSGKSSLAFDTIYAESRQRFLTGMSIAGRSQLSQLERPAFDRITGLPPAIAISQQQAGRNPRSTVGTATDLTALLRSLFAGIGVRHCPECGRAVEKLTAAEMIEILRHCRPGTVQEIAPFGAAEPERTLVVPAGPEESGGRTSGYSGLLADTITNSLAAGNGAVRVRLDGGPALTFQTTETCPHCDHLLFELTPADFSYNHPESMCPVCLGLGTVTGIDADRIIRHPEKSLLDNASPYWKDLRKFSRSPNANWMKGEVLALAAKMSVDLELPWQDLPEKFRQKALFGTGEQEVSYQFHNSGGRTGTITRPVEGAYNCLKRLLLGAGTDRQAYLHDEFLTSSPCHCCHGERLKMESRLVTVAGTRYPEVISMSLDELQEWTAGLPGRLSDADSAIARPLLNELYGKLTGYRDAGLGYLALDRPAPSLSGGEYQRLRLVSQLSSEISHILYVLDEPTAGLHPKDYDKLAGIIRRLKGRNNTVIIVEHARAIMNAADYILDIGGGSGALGGYLIAQGTPPEICADPASETGRYLSGRKSLSRPARPHISEYDAWIHIDGICGNNLMDVDICFPQRAITCVTGVSGSGKSSLMNYGIIPAVSDCINGTGGRSGRTYRQVTGAGTLERIIHIDQRPIGRSSRSTPATYTGVMDELRSVFAKTEAARSLGFTQGHFSYNSKEGQCPACRGYGYQSMDAAFMPEARITCHLCRGTKFHNDVLTVGYRGKTIADILNMSVAEALDFFTGNKKLAAPLQLLKQIGLGYLTLGQSSQTLSGGEAQRIKLAAELNVSAGRPTLYLLDEPTTGLHFADIQNLLDLLQTITEHGHTVILIEHNPDVVKNADWIIDLGPEGGADGGRILVQGTVDQAAACAESHTGKMLMELSGCNKHI